MGEAFIDIRHPNSTLLNQWDLGGTPTPPNVETAIGENWDDRNSNDQNINCGVAEKGYKCGLTDPTVDADLVKEYSKIRMKFQYIGITSVTIPGAALQIFKNGVWFQSVLAKLEWPTPKDAYVEFDLDPAWTPEEYATLQIGGISKDGQYYDIPHYI